MLFSSLVFLVAFLPSVIFIHAILPARARNAFLLAASVVFYAWGEPSFALLILLSSAANYGLALAVSRSKQPWKRRLYLFASLMLNFGSLFWFKYAGFLLGFMGVPRQTLPLGISFYTFQIQAYVIDVYRGEAEADKSWVDCALFILLFPQLIAGPIVLYRDIRAGLKRRSITPGALEHGMTQFIAGFLTSSNALLLIAACALCVPKIARMLWRFVSKTAPIRIAAFLMALLLCVASLVNEGYNPFLYFRF
ncbi:hypothetical protein AGMMS49992_01240 [Clostridia bacterium]|nr:hypothetical protein AGMMS49992_01240 [Clostridia bacterium]